MSATNQSRPGSRAAARMLFAIAALACAGAQPGSAAAQGPRLPGLADELVARLQGGGYVLACRHGITSHEPTSAPPSDPFAVRPLNDAGERQMRDAGAALRRLGIRLSDVRTSPYARTRRSAELMFGSAEVEDALYGQDRDVQLLALLTTPVRHGNRGLVTHQALLQRILGLPPRSIEEGDCVIVRPLSDRFELVAQVPAADWARHGR